MSTAELLAYIEERRAELNPPADDPDWLAKHAEEMTVLELYQDRMKERLGGDFERIAREMGWQWGWVSVVEAN